MANNTGVEVHFADPEVQKCPFSSYQKLSSANKPVYLDPDTGHYQVLDYQLVKVGVLDGLSRAD